MNLRLLRSIFIGAAVLQAGGSVFALTPGELARKAVEFGTTEKAQLEGPMVDYLQRGFNTRRPVFGEASVVRKISPGCHRVRLVVTIPGLIVEATDPDNRAAKRQGPFVSTQEVNLCDKQWQRN